MRVKLARDWRDEAAAWRDRGQEAWTTAWLVAVGWTGAVWGLYFLAGVIRKGFDSDAGSDPP